MEKYALERSHHLFTLSARSPQAVQQAADKLRLHLEQAPNQPLGNLAYTLHVGREEFDDRLALVAESREELQALCKLAAAGALEEGAGAIRERKRRTGAAKVAFLFSGQGAQYSGMGKALYESSPFFRQVCEECFAIVKPYYPLPFAEYLFNPEQQEELKRIPISSTAMFILEYALAALWMSWGVRPDYVLGHSNGEYVAACVAGAWSLRDALLAVVKRAYLMEEGTERCWLMAVSASREQLQVYLDAYGEDVSLATINSPQQYVLAGRRDAMERLNVQLDQEGVMHRLLPISTASHSVFMEPILPDYRAFLEQEITFQELQIPLVTNLTGEIVEGQTLGADYWCRQLRETVQFATGIETLLGAGVNTFVEIGPHPVLTTVFESLETEGDEVVVPSLNRKEPDWKTLQTSLGQLWAAGLTIDWHAFDHEYKRRRVHAPTYAFELKSYWAQPSGEKRKLFAGREVESVGSATSVSSMAALQPEPEVVRSPEEWVRKIWHEVLGVKEVGWEDNFLHLGGESLNLIQVQSRLNKALKLRVRLQDLYAHTAFGDLVAFLEQAMREAGKEWVTSQAVARESEAFVSGEVSLAPIQRALFDGSGMDPEFFFLSLCFEADKLLDPELLKQTLNLLYRQHDMLRAAYEWEDDVMRQFVLSPQEANVELLQYDLSDVAHVEEREANFLRIEQELAQSITFKNGLMNRAALFRWADGCSRVLWIVSHLYTDSLSIRILSQDFLETYERLERGQDVTLGEKSASYQEWVEMSRDYINSEYGEVVRAYWSQMLEPIAEARIELKPEQVRAMQTDLRSRTLTVDAERTAVLRTSLGAAHGTSFKEVLTALVSRVLAKWTGRERVCFAINGHGREPLHDDFSLDVSRTVGFFVNNYPFYADVPIGQTAAQTIEATHERLQQMPHNGTSFNMLRYLSEDPLVREAFQGYKAPDVLLNYQGEFNSHSSTSNEWREVPTGNVEQPANAELQYQLVFVSYIHNGELIVHLNHAEHLQDGVVRLGGLFEEEIEQLIGTMEKV